MKEVLFEAAKAAAEKCIQAKDDTESMAVFRALYTVIEDSGLENDYLKWRYGACV